MSSSPPASSFSRNPRSPPPLRARIHTLASSLNSNVETFGPPTEDDTPRTQKAWKFLLDISEDIGMFIATRLPRRMIPEKPKDVEGEDEAEETLVEREDGDQSDKEGDGDGENGSGPAKQSKEEKAHIDATKRAETILGACSEPAVSAEALFDLITVPHIVHTTNAGAIESYVEQVLLKIEAIKFATEWNRGGNGSVKDKIQYNTDLFQAGNPKIFHGRRPNEKAKLMLTHSDEFEAFKTARGPLITGRNRLQEAWVKFGLVVLLDPFWRVENLGTKRAKKYRDVVEVLDVLTRSEDRLDDDGNTQLDLLEADNLEVLLGIVKMLCSDEAERKTVLTFIKNFLEKYPSSVQAVY
ncbi:hypothetical protein C8J57DRAFT_1727185 [Mycena rebaudengoi]|nr:hypothetical protein C8J57DRAFT_1727185 [Mycena rebaudengoi]